MAPGVELDADARTRRLSLLHCSHSRLYASCSPHAVECELVEDAGAFVAHRPTAADRPRRAADQHRRRRRLSMGLAGSWCSTVPCTAFGTRLPVTGYVKTHHRRMFAREHWVRVPELTAGKRSGLFAMKDALYGCYLRVGDPGPWAGPCAGIARLEMPSSIGRDATVEGGRPGRGVAAGLRVGAAPGRTGPPVNLR